LPKACFRQRRNLVVASVPVRTPIEVAPPLYPGSPAGRESGGTIKKSGVNT
jgi:hypothetical protein